MVSRSSSSRAYVPAFPPPSRTPSAHAAASEVAAHASAPRSQCGTSRSNAHRRRAGGTVSGTVSFVELFFLFREPPRVPFVGTSRVARHRATIAAAASGDARRSGASVSDDDAFESRTENNASHTSPRVSRRRPRRRGAAAPPPQPAVSESPPSTSATSAGAAAGSSAESAAFAASLPSRDRSLSAPRNANADDAEACVTAADQRGAAPPYALRA